MTTDKKNILPHIEKKEYNKNNICNVFNDCKTIQNKNNI